LCLKKPRGQHTGELKLLHINIQCLRNKVNELTIAISGISPDILCITEDWLTELELVNTHLSGYKLISFYCRNIYKNNGVAIFVKPILDASPLKLSSIEKNLRMCCTETNIRKNVLQN
jgi:hypothetical protein